MHSNKTPLINRLRHISDSINMRDAELSEFVEYCRITGENPEKWYVIYNEAKQALILFAPDGTQYKPAPAEGDKFDIYTGFCLAVFNNQLGLTYQDINRFFTMFTKRTKTNDPALNFIRKLIEETTGISESDLLARIETAQEDRSGKHFAINVPICLVSIDETESECDCECCPFDETRSDADDPIERLIRAIFNA